ncbi:hypothetical protein CXG81DRAFT_11098, partial [Caulochytrium protostelioides]
MQAWASATEPLALSRDVVDHLCALYSHEIADPVPQYDPFGLVIKESLTPKDVWQARFGLSKLLAKLSPAFMAPSPTEAAAGDTSVFDAFMTYALESGALGDTCTESRDGFVTACTTALKQYGGHHTDALFSIFEQYSNGPSPAAAKLKRFHADFQREALVILSGALAAHLSAGDPLVERVLQQLLASLDTPAVSVQMTVAETLPGVISRFTGSLEAVVMKLLRDLGNARAPTRRGAAFGLAGIVKGRGLGALKELQIMVHLQAKVGQRSSATQREGAIVAFQSLSLVLGRLFEPYVAQVLPLLLQTFGDTDVNVRHATQECCKTIMSKLSAYCVKLVLPSLLHSLAPDQNWRTKTGSIEALGAMAYLAPKQLAMSLPIIVPALTEALTDSHTDVQNAALAAFGQIGHVIKNPEIQAISARLLTSLTTMAGDDTTGLDAILATSFVHYVDAPSLALIVPLIERGLRSRQGDIKRKAAQIVGNLALIVEKRDLSVYLEHLLRLL